MTKCIRCGTPKFMRWMLRKDFCNCEYKETKEDRTIKPCNICGCELRDKNLKNIQYINGLIEEVYIENCNECEQLLYGYVKPVGKIEV